MHYSAKLKQELEQAQKRIEMAEQAIIEFKAHLQSSKFFQDTTIQVKDVQNYLSNILDDLRGCA